MISNGRTLFYLAFCAVFLNLNMVSTDLEVEEVGEETTIHTLHPIITTTTELNPTPSPVCKHPKGYNISLLTKY
jgi:hypothetical protein